MRWILTYTNSEHSIENRILHDTMIYAFIYTSEHADIRICEIDQFFHNVIDFWDAR